MISTKYGFGLETKFCRFENGVSVSDGASIEGYGSLFGKPDQGGDVVEKGAYAKSLQGLAQKGRAKKCFGNMTRHNRLEFGKTCGKMSTDFTLRGGF